ncbi:IS3 family transposase [Streptomyces sp. NPDC002917]|uniref:IS3 family transposase n=1 Tax=unclassified Streptomyces TaxID=2593676 RepID=UPI00339DCCD7
MDRRRRRARAERQAAEDAQVEEIREIHGEHRGNYGALCIHAGLRGFGHTVNRMRVARPIGPALFPPLQVVPRPTPPDPRG